MRLLYDLRKCCAQSHRFYGLMQQLVTFGLRCTQRLGIDIAAHEESWNWSGQRASQLIYGVYAGLAVAQVIVGNDQIRQLGIVSKPPEDYVAGLTGNHMAAPAAYQTAHSF